MTTTLNMAPTLYHGTTEESAESLLHNGWQPNAWSAGANRGQPKFLYLTTDPEDALWFAQQKGGSSVLEIRGLAMDDINLDPEDACCDTLADELRNPLGLPGKVVLTRSKGPCHFSMFSFAPAPARAP